MKLAIAEFGEVLKKAGNSAVGLFYYAGHGVHPSCLVLDTFRRSGGAASGRRGIKNLFVGGIVIWGILETIYWTIGREFILRLSAN